MAATCSVIVVFWVKGGFFPVEVCKQGNRGKVE